MRIVIIEDERDLGVLMHNFLVRLLNRKASIQVVTSLSEGLHCVEQTNPDWVFIDNNLPDGKGIDEIQNIKSSSLSKSTRKIVMMSAMTNLREEALKNGADFFLDKPISFSEIRSIFSEVH